VSYSTIDKLGDLELVALVLGMKPSDAAVSCLASAMVSEGWLTGAPLAEVVREVGGVGDRRIARLEASVELGRRALAGRAARKGCVVSTPEQVVELVKPMLIGKNREHFLCLALSTKNLLLKVIEVSVGSLNASIVHPRELFREAIAVSAASVVIVHVHPSGDPSPSGADLQLTRRLVKAGEVLGVEVLDHVILGGDSHVSLRETGAM